MCTDAYYVALQVGLDAATYDVDDVVVRLVLQLPGTTVTVVNQVLGRAVGLAAQNFAG